MTTMTANDKNTTNILPDAERVDPAAETFRQRLEKEDKFITALFYNGENNRDFDLTTLAIASGPDEDDETYKNDKKLYFRDFIDELAEKFLDRFEDDLPDFSEIYILGRVDLDKNRHKEERHEKEPVNKRD
jgi:hypothetical protein